MSTGFGGEFGILSDPLSAASANTERQRLLGWVDALDSARITPTVVRLPHADAQETGEEAARLLMDLDAPPTAILCFSDAIAVGVIGAIQDRGLSVPDDVSVVGFDDNPIARRTKPLLTTVRQDSQAKGGRQRSCWFPSLTARSRDRRSVPDTSCCRRGWSCEGARPSRVEGAPPATAEPCPPLKPHCNDFNHQGCPPTIRRSPR